MTEEYYLQNKNAGYLGNSPTWWAKDGRGYTAYILGAHRFSKEEAEDHVKRSPGKLFMFKCADIDARLHLVFDMQDFKRLGTDAPCGWDSGYAVNPSTIAAINDAKTEWMISRATGNPDIEHEKAQALVKALAPLKGP